MVIIPTARNINQVLKFDSNQGLERARKRVPIRWGKPHQGWIKLNTNASTKGNSGLSSAGELLRDSDGRWLGGFVHFVGLTSLVHAEMWAVRLGLKLPWDVECHNIVLEVDSEVVSSLFE